MIAKHAIEDSIPYLKPTDKVFFALELMEEFKVFHLPVVEKKKLFGIVSEEQMLELDENLLIKNFANYINSVFSTCLFRFSQ